MDTSLNKPVVFHFNNTINLRPCNLIQLSPLFPSSPLSFRPLPFHSLLLFLLPRTFFRFVFCFTLSTSQTVYCRRQGLRSRRTHHLQQSAGQRDLCPVSVDLPSASENISVLHTSFPVTLSSIILNLFRHP